MWGHYHIHLAYDVPLGFFIYFSNCNFLEKPMKIHKIQAVVHKLRFGRDVDCVIVMVFFSTNEWIRECFFLNLNAEGVRGVEYLKYLLFNRVDGRRGVGNTNIQKKFTRTRISIGMGIITISNHKCMFILELDKIKY